MKKIITPKEISFLIKGLKRKNEKIVLAGGCFDILHKGHLKFLKEAKKRGTKLIILLEDDKNVKKLKGKKRPIHNQLARAKILSSIKDVDFIVLLSNMKNSKKYAKLINQIKPFIIAITEDDSYKEKKENQAKGVGAELISVTKRMKNESTTKLVEMIKEKI